MSRTSRRAGCSRPGSSSATCRGTVSNFRSTGDLGAYLAGNNIVGIAGIDTRRLTRLLRENGVQNGCLLAAAAIGDAEVANAVARARAAPSMTGQDLARVVSCTAPYEWTAGTWTLDEGYSVQQSARFHVVAYDFGIKQNILRMLAERGCKVTVVPAQTSAEAALAYKPDGVFLSNGPGDPEPCDYAIRAIREIVDSGMPTFGICLGHQLLGLASGGRTIKMKFGHHGANHPVQDKRHRPRADHEPEPWLRRRSGVAARDRARDARVALRRQPAGHRAHRPAGLQLPGTSGSEPRAARPRLSVRPVREDDGE